MFVLIQCVAIDAEGVGVDIGGIPSQFRLQD